LLSSRAVQGASVLVWAAAVAGTAGCTQQQLVGHSPAYLIISSLQGANGAEPDTLSDTVDSDVITLVKTQGDERVPTIFEDPGKVTFTLGLKDPGSAETPSQPTSANFITVNRYHVQFVRTDGRNTPGVDVPYPFDGAATGTVTGAGGSLAFILVRSQAKQEAPLKALAEGDLTRLSGAGAISTIAQVTFYGSDQAGRDVSVMGQISVNFANWGDPE
jgi:hypothetical protein